MHEAVRLADVLALDDPALQGAPDVARHQDLTSRGAVRRELGIGDRQEAELAALEHSPVGIDEARLRAPEHEPPDGV